MLYHFKQAAHLAGKDYPRGNNEISEKAEASPFFLKLVKAGLIVEVEASKIVTAESLKQKQDKLLNKVAARQKKILANNASKEEAPVAPPVAPPEPPQEEKEEAPVEVESPQADEEPKEEDSKEEAPEPKQSGKGKSSKPGSKQKQG